MSFFKNQQPEIYSFSNRARTGLFYFSMILVLGQAFDAQSLAAKKYYPPSFKPLGNEAQKPVDEPRRPIILRQDPVVPSNNSPQVIIKNVPVTVVVKAKPKDPLISMIEQRRFFEALRLVDKRIQKSPRDLNLKMTRAQILREMRNYEQAVTEYQNVIIKAGASKAAKSNAYTGLGLTYVHYSEQAKSLGDNEESKAFIESATKAVKQALEADLQNNMAWTVSALLKLNENNLDSAEKDIRKAISLAPHNSYALLTQSQVLLAKNKPEDALPIIFKARTENPQEPQIALYLGQAYLMLGRYDDAIIQLKQFTERVPDNSEGLKFLSTAYQSKAKPDDAEQALQKAITVNAGDVNAVTSLLKLYEVKGDQDRSILLLRNLVKEQPGQLFYTQQLMQRLVFNQQFDDAYQLGSGQVEALLVNKDASPLVIDEILRDFTFVSWVKNKDTLTFPALSTQSVFQKIMNRAQTRLTEPAAVPSSRLIIALINPLSPLPAVTELPQTATGVEDILLSAHLKGDLATKEKTLSQLTGPGAFTDEELWRAAFLSLQSADYTSAKKLTATITGRNKTFTKAAVLHETIISEEKKALTDLEGLQSFPKKQDNPYWLELAARTIGDNTGNWKVYMLVGDYSQKQRNFQRAQHYYLLANQYNPPATEKKEITDRLKKLEKETGKRK